MRPGRIVIPLLAIATLLVVIPPRAVPIERNELTMVVWGMPFEDALFRDGYARDFEAMNPGWTVHYQRHRDVVPKYKAWHVLGRGADVMRLPITDYHAMLALGIIEPLDRFIADPDTGLSVAERADYLPFLWEVLEVDGVRAALPSDNAQYGLYYNPALFDAYNAVYPETPLEYPNDSWTWADLKRAADALTRRTDGQITQYGLLFDLWAWPFMAFHAQAGGELWDADETTTLINGPSGVEALEFMVSVIPPDAPMRSPQLAESAAGPAQLFKAGQLAMLLDGSWRAPNVELDAPELDFAIVPLPSHRTEAIVSGSVLWCVSAHSPNQRKAWEMIKWLTNREQSLRYWNVLRVAPPARVSVIESPEFRTSTGLIGKDGQVFVPPMTAAEYPKRAAWLQAAITPDPETGETPGFVPVAPYQADLERLIGRALVQAVRGEKTPQEALDEAANELHAIIDRDRRLRGVPAVERNQSTSEDTEEH